MRAAKPTSAGQRTRAPERPMRGRDTSAFVQPASYASFTLPSPLTNGGCRDWPGAPAVPVQNQPRPTSPRRFLALPLAVVLVTSAVMLAAPAPANAAKASSCAKAVIADWFDNGRVDRVYPQRCYREAIKILPVDVRDYSSAREDILRALLYARQGKPDPGDQGDNGQQNGGGGGTPTGGSNAGGGGGEPPPTTTVPGGEDPTKGGGEDPSTTLDTAGPSAVPLPLIVLAAIAALLLALGAAGYVSRRSGARSGGGDAPAA